MSITRRDFVKSSLTAGLGLAMATPFSRVRGANDEIRVAVVGVNGRGGSHIKEFQKIDGVRVVALCDIDTKVLDSRAAAFEKQYGQTVAKYVDIRQMLDEADIDVVSVATTNHWHALATIWACQAGKDVYVEKPCSHNVFEGRQAVKAARKYNRIVQHGTQSRASGSWAKRIAAAQSGQYGKLLVSKGYCCKPRWSIGFKPYEEVPEHVNFDLWLGPAPDAAVPRQSRPLQLALVLGFWQRRRRQPGRAPDGHRALGNSRCGVADECGHDGRSMGRWPQLQGPGPDANMELSVFDYGETLLVFETRGLVDKRAGFDGIEKKFPRIVDNEFYCEAGVIKGDRFYPDGQGDGEPLVKVDSHRYPGGNFENFIHCVRSRQREEQHADILEGHYSSALCHLGNISYRMGWEYPFTTKTDALGKCGIVTDAMMTVLANTKAIGVDPDRATYCLGPKLQIDPAKERFIDNAPANLMLSRFYREPFVVPENV